MNKIYKVIWSKAKNCYVVASELAKRHTKSPVSGVYSRTLVAGVLACVLSCGAVLPVYAGYTAGGAHGSSNPGSNWAGVAIGEGASAKDDGVAIGYNVVTNGGSNEIAIGDHVYLEGQGSIHIGSIWNSDSSWMPSSGNTGTYGAYDITMGVNTLNRGSSNVLFGGYGYANGNGLVGLGYATYATGFGGVAIGAGSVVNEDMVVSFGHRAGDSYINEEDGDSAARVIKTHESDEFRRLINVADGIDNHDVATVGQLKKYININADFTDETLPVAEGQNSIASGLGAKALGNNTIAIGTENVVTGNNSGAFGDPNIVNGDNSYVVGNNSAVHANVKNAFVLGNNTSVSNGLPAGWDTMTDAEKEAWVNSLETTDVKEGVVALGNNISVSLDNKSPNSRSSTSAGTPEIEHVVAVGDNVVIGEENAIGIGHSATATALDTVAMGDDAQATMEGAIAVGHSTRATNSFSNALGYLAQATGEGAGAFGQDAQATGDFTVAFGRGTRATAESATAVGNNAKAISQSSIAIGTSSIANGGANTNAVAIGRGATIGSDTQGYGETLAIGSGTNVQNTFGSALGSSANVTGQKGTAIGYNSSVTATNAIALGADSVADVADTVSVGSASATRKIVNVTTGSADTDASTVGQTGSDLDINGTTLQLKNANGTVLDSVTLPTSSGGGSVPFIGINSTGSGSTANYDGSGAVGNDSIAIGSSSSTAYRDSIAIGNNADSYGEGGTVIGFYAQNGNSDSNTKYGTAVGYRAKAYGEDSVGLGYRAEAFGKDSISIGWSDAYGQNSIAMGGGIAGKVSNTASDDDIKNYNIAIGHNSIASEYRSNAIGYGVHAYGVDSTAIGTMVNAYGTNDVAFGRNVIAGGSLTTPTTSASAFGVNVSALGNNSFVAGSSSEAVGSGSSAIGYRSKAYGENSIAIGGGVAGGGSYAVAPDEPVANTIAIGNSSSASGEGSVALGTNSVALDANVLSLGYGTSGSPSEMTRKIQHVTAGTEATDAVNVSQLNAAVAGITDTNSTTHLYAGTGTASNASTTNGNTKITIADDTTVRDSLTIRGAGGTSVTSDGNGVITISSATSSGNANYVGINSSGGSNTTGEGAVGTDSIAIGRNVVATESYAIGIGTDVTVGGPTTGAMGIGDSVISSGDYSIAIGHGSRAYDKASVALGDAAVSHGVRNTAVGSASYVYENVTNSTALGGASVATESNVVSFGHKTGDVISWTLPGNPNDYDLQTYDSDLTRRLINVSAGTSASDAATVAQTIELGNGTNTVVTANGTNSIGQAKYKIDVEGNGTISNGNTGLISGGTLYNEVHVSTDGTYVKGNQTVATNLKALDTQVKANADEIAGLGLDKANVSLDNITSDGQTVVRNLAKEAVKVVAGTSTTVTEGTDGNAKTYAVNVTKDGTVVSGNTGVVTGGTVYNAIQTAISELEGDTSTALAGKANVDASNVTDASAWGNKIATGAVAENDVKAVSGGTVYTAITNEATARSTEDTNLSNRIGTVSTDGNYIKASTTKNVSENLGLLDTAVKANADAITDLGTDKANVSLNNITTAGETVIKGLAKDSVNVVGADKATVTKSDVSGVDTYTVSVKADGTVAQGNENLVSGGTVYEAIQNAIGSSESDMDAALAGKANVALDNVTDAGHTVIKTDAKSAVNVVGGNYATVDKTDVNGVDTYTVNVATDGTVTDGDTKLVTGDTVYDALQAESRPSANGNYIATNKSAGENLTALDLQVKTNADNIVTNTSDITNLKDLSNITEAGETVIKELSKGSVNVIGTNRATVTKSDVSGVDTYTVDVQANGVIADGNENIVSGGTQR